MGGKFSKPDVDLMKSRLVLSRKIHPEQQPAAVPAPTSSDSDNVTFYLISAPLMSTKGQRSRRHRQSSGIHALRGALVGKPSVILEDRTLSHTATRKHEETQSAAK